MVIADRVAIYVNEVFNNVGEYEGAELLIGVLLFAFQIYCDFSGYSDIAIGIARTFGFNLMKNFDSPYFSKSITEFWRRWHISLSTWFRDYVYIPLGGSKKGKYRTYLNLFLVFFISGIWHGAAMTFIVWGAIHGLIIVVEKVTSKERTLIMSKVGLKRSGYFGNTIFTLVTFTIVCFAWIFFRANSISDSLMIVKKIYVFESGFKNLFTELNLDPKNFALAIVFIVLMIVFENLHKRFNMSYLLSKQPTFIRWLFYLCSALLLIIFGIYGDYDQSEFIYFQF